MPADVNDDYAKQSYWDRRYAKEDRYDWFSTVYSDCVDAAFEAVEKVYAEQKSIRAMDGVAAPLSVLHLGIGNSNLCEDLYKMFRAKYSDNRAPYRLVQVAVDYSPVVIARMRAKYANRSLGRHFCRQAAVGDAIDDEDDDEEEEEEGEQENEKKNNQDRKKDENDKKENPMEEEADEGCESLPDTHWEVADVRDLTAIRAAYGPYFDVVIDKATMDAFQANANANEAAEGLLAMLRQVSDCLSESVRASSAPSRFRRFVQMTWEIPYKRLALTTPDEAPAYAWGHHVAYRYLGDSDMYRVYNYDVLPRVTPL